MAKGIDALWKQLEKEQGCPMPTVNGGSPSSSRRARPKWKLSKPFRAQPGFKEAGINLSLVRAGVYDEMFKRKLGLFGNTVDDPLADASLDLFSSASAINQLLAAQVMKPAEIERRSKEVGLRKIAEMEDTLARVSTNEEVIKDENRQLKKENAEIDDALWTWRQSKCSEGCKEKDPSDDSLESRRLVDTSVCVPHDSISEFTVQAELTED